MKQYFLDQISRVINLYLGQLYNQPYLPEGNNKVLNQIGELCEQVKSKIIITPYRPHKNVIMTVHSSIRPSCHKLSHPMQSQFKLGVTS